MKSMAMIIVFKNYLFKNKKMETNIYKIFYLFLLDSENIPKYYNYLISNYYHIFIILFIILQINIENFSMNFQNLFNIRDNSTIWEKYQQLYLCHYSNHSFDSETFLDKDVVSIILNFL